MSCPIWQWDRIGSHWSPVRTLPVARLGCDTVTWDSSRANVAGILPEQTIKALARFQCRLVRVMDGLVISPRNYSISPFRSMDGLSPLGLDCAHAEIADNDNRAHARSLIGRLNAHKRSHRRYHDLGPVGGASR